MTSKGARKAIKDALASGLYKPKHLVFYKRGRSVIRGCALCGLYIGCGGDPIIGNPHDADLLMTAFLVQVKKIKRSELFQLEDGYESDRFNNDNGYDKNKPWIKLGIDLRDKKI